jgi:sulfur-oxidizing protein SoxX
LAAALLAGAAGPLLPYQVEGDSIAVSLTGREGDPARGRAIMSAREISTCALCHGGPFADSHFQGTVGPSLSGVGARLSAGQIRLRIVDAAAVNPQTIMPRFYTVSGLTRVARKWQGQPILSAEQIEDVVAYLTTLRTS